MAEGESIHLECTYEPARDNDLRVVWEKNGAPIPAGQLVKTGTELGTASLHIDSANPGHAGLYTLKIRNGLGEAASSATVKVAGSAAVLDQTQHLQSWQRIQDLEAPKPKVTF